ncbi:MAG: hypothetical protein MH208_10525 [Marinobacter sp.]|nr:hypothetical protein [Marinobacter sp.]
MSWMDLGLHLIGRYVPPTVVQALGRFLLVDTGARQQSYYRSFHTCVGPQRPGHPSRATSYSPSL